MQRQMVPETQGLHHAQPCEFVSHAAAPELFEVHEFLDSDDAVADYIRIRLQQRNSRKSLTTVQGVPADLDLKKMLRAFKKMHGCNGAIVPSDDGEVMQFQGDQRLTFQTFLVRAGIPASRIRNPGVEPESHCAVLVKACSSRDW
eukprot:CAMPEP_0114543356 /NCGR_PEP_ID=MMETSP0114-20121206/2311_1 /TAXON_ID=31324 /ORGANISM="Goniomonas sp, Strain m" /LENGTH=144 /DNA_ID=CAMNT_0001727687 /DNA_START=64 /DNA_END=495 /DNA_ORIENTATION=-